MSKREQHDELLGWIAIVCDIAGWFTAAIIFCPTAIILGVLAKRSPKHRVLGNIAIAIACIELFIILISVILVTK